MSIQAEPSGDSAVNPVKSNSRSIYSLAAGMLRNDSRMALPMYALLLLPGLGKQLGIFETPLLLYLLEKLTAFSFLFLLCRHWALKLSMTTVPFRLDFYFKFLAWGCLIWLPFDAALWALQDGLLFSSGFSIIYLVLLFISIEVALYHYFFFVPLVLNTEPLSRVFEITRSITAKNRFLALRVIFPPLAVMLLIWAVIKLLFLCPDASLPEVEWLLFLTSKIFWFLSSYLALAVSLSNLGAKDWYELKLEPYREARFETICLKQPDWLARTLTPAQAVKLLALCFLLELGNLYLFTQTPTSVSFDIKAIEIDGSFVTLDAFLSDPKNHFRGFNPFYLRLAGDQNPLINYVSPLPSSVIVDQKQQIKSILDLPRDRTQLSVRLKFETERDSNGLKDLKDLYLWYLSTQIMLLDMRQAAIVEPPNANQPVS